MIFLLLADKYGEVSVAEELLNEETERTSNMSSNNVKSAKKAKKKKRSLKLIDDLQCSQLDTSVITDDNIADASPTVKKKKRKSEAIHQDVTSPTKTKKQKKSKSISWLVTAAL